MKQRPIVLHLIDDTTPGGVTALLDYICSSTELARSARHMMQVVPKNTASVAQRADVIVSHLAINWRSLPGLIACRARHAATPMIHVEHSYTEASTALNVPVKLRFFTLLRTAYALFDHVVSVSPQQAGWMRRRKLVNENALRVITPVVPLAPFRGLPVPDHPVRVIGAVGRLHRQKGFDVLITAFRALRDTDCALRICGTGPEEASLRTLAQGDRRISFDGFAEQTTEFLSGVDAVALPSRWEAFGLVALEARAAGRAVLASDIDGLPSSAGPSAVLVSHSTPQAWTQALSDLIGTRGAATDPTRADGAEEAFITAWTDLVKACGPQQNRAA